MNSRTARMMTGPAAVLLALGMVAVSPPLRAQEPPTSFRWSLEVPGTGTLIIDLAPGWTPNSPQGGDGLADWRATTRSRCEMTVRIVASPLPDPAFNGPTALHDFVRRQAEALLPEAIEARYTLLELRGPEAGGYYFALRERAPRRKRHAYVTQGAVGLGNLRAEFTLRSPAPDLAEIQKALKALAAARLDRQAAEGGTP
jgi:hypothetical protein